MAAGYEYEDMTVEGDQVSIGIELDPVRIACWTGDDGAAGALRCGSFHRWFWTTTRSCCRWWRAR